MFRSYGARFNKRKRAINTSSLWDSDQSVIMNICSKVNTTSLPVALVSLLSETRSAQSDRRPAKVRVEPCGPRPQL